MATTMHRSSTLCFVLLAGCLMELAQAQVLSPDRGTDWSLAGFQLPVPEPTQVLDITAFGGVGDGSTPTQAALAAALSAAQGQMTAILFPPGDFLFTAPVTLPDSVVLRGASADSTTLTFALGGAGHCIRAVGQQLVPQTPITADAPRCSTFLPLASTAGLAVGDELRLHRNDTALVVSPWAIGSTGQIVRVTAVTAAGVEIAAPLRAHYTPSGSAYVRKRAPRRFVGIECLRLVRTDATTDQWSNIQFQHASHCWLRGVESVSCNFAHLEIFASTSCVVSGSYFHHAFNYGAGGKAYGTMLFFTSGENLIVDNVFEHLRHSMIVETGANGNVFAYNHSTDPFWSEGLLPPNSAGELVCHGDHPYLNLFEGNTVGNIVLDDSHGSNGPFNTFFRNRASLWGYFMSNAPATDSTNIIGNEVPGTLYLVNGNGHLEHGNDFQGNTVPPGTGTLAEVSLFLAAQPDFLQVLGGWPQLGPGSVSPGSTPAAERFAAGTDITVCEAPDLPTAFDGMRHGLALRAYPVPVQDVLRIEGLRTGVALRSVQVVDATGRHHQLPWRAIAADAVEVTGFEVLPTGLYVVELSGEGVPPQRARVIKR